MALSSIIKLILSALLLLCLFDWPYGFYMFVRTVAMIGFGILAFDAFGNEQGPLGIVYIGLLILFQPLIKIHLGRELWNIVDVIAAVILIVSLFIKSTNAKN